MELEKGDIEFVVKFRPAEHEPLITYEIAIGLDDKNKAVVKKYLILTGSQKGEKIKPWKQKIS